MTMLRKAVGQVRKIKIQCDFRVAKMSCQTIRCAFQIPRPKKQDVRSPKRTGERQSGTHAVAKLLRMSTTTQDTIRKMRISLVFENGGRHSRRRVMQPLACRRQNVSRWLKLELLHDDCEWRVRENM